MKDSVLTITENQALTKDVYRMKLQGDIGSLFPGQFVNIQLKDRFLRRPISVCDVAEDTVIIIYKKVGAGTADMTRMQVNDTLQVMSELGNGYHLDQSGESPVLLGGGVGVPPLYYLAKQLRGQNKKVQVILGFNTKSEIFYEKEFKDLGCEVTVTTADGTYGQKGFVTDALKDMQYTYTYSCGPLPMLKAVYNVSKTDGEYSFEERMGCGFGACMGCSKKTKTGYKRVCKDGPVFTKEEIVWED